MDPIDCAFPPLLRVTISSFQGNPTDKAIQEALDQPEVQEQFLQWRTAHPEVQTQPLVGRIHRLATESKGWTSLLAPVTSYVGKLWSTPIPPGIHSQVLDEWIQDPGNVFKEERVLSLVVGSPESRAMVMTLVDYLEEGALSPDQWVALLSSEKYQGRSPLHDISVVTVLVPLLERVLQKGSLSGQHIIELLQQARTREPSPLADEVVNSLLFPLLASCLQKGRIQGAQILMLFRDHSEHVRSNLLSPHILSRFLPLLRDSVTSGGLTEEEVLALFSEPEALDLWSKNGESLALCLNFLKERVDQMALPVGRILEFLQQPFAYQRCLLTQKNSSHVIVLLLNHFVNERKITGQEWVELLRYRPDRSLWWSKAPLCSEIIPLFRQMVEQDGKSGETVVLFLMTPDSSGRAPFLESEQRELLIPVIHDALSTGKCSVDRWIELLLEKPASGSLLSDSVALSLLAPLLGEGLKQGWLSHSQLCALLQSPTNKGTTLAHSLVLNKQFLPLLQEIQQHVGIDLLVGDVLVPTLHQVERSVHTTFYQPLALSYLPFLEQAWQHHAITREQFNDFPGSREAIVSFLNRSCLPAEKVLELLPKIRAFELLAMRVGSRQAIVFAKREGDPRVVVLAEEIIGEGSYGVVYVAERAGVAESKRYAVKVARLEMSKSSTHLRNEVAMLSVIYRSSGEKSLQGIQKKPWEVLVLDSPQKTVCYLRSWYQGDLVDLMQRPGEFFSLAGEESRKLPPQEKEQWSNDLMAGLDTVHKAGVFHRDIKPPNVLVKVSGRKILVQLADFGSAKLVVDCIREFKEARSQAMSQGMRWPQTQSVISRFFSDCTLEYLCYEDVNAARGAFEAGNVDQFLAHLRHAEDFSLGCVLYELWTNQSPRSSEYSPVMGFKVARVVIDEMTLFQSLLAAQCPEPLAKQIVAMIKPL